MKRRCSKRSGYSVVTAASAQQGLGLVATHKFDAVLLDHEMPDMNGCDVAFQIKRVRPELVVILLSLDPGNRLVL
jgi:CheY-like chemotaxis protein